MQETYTLVFELESDDRNQLDLIEQDLKQTQEEVAFSLRNQARHVQVRLERSSLATGDEKPLSILPSELRDIVEKAKQEERDSYIRIAPVDLPPFKRAEPAKKTTTPARGRPRKVNNNI